MTLIEAKPCASCGESMIWAVSAASGTPQPVDPEPVPGGNIKLWTDAPTPIAEVITPSKDRLAYMPHHATCAKRRRYRKPPATERTEDLLHRIYEDGGRLNLEDGKIKPSRVEGAWTDDEKTAIRSRRKELRSLLEDDPDVMTALFIESVSAALRYAPMGCDLDEHIAGPLNEAQDAYEVGDVGLARYLLHIFIERCQESIKAFVDAPDQGELFHVEAEVRHRDVG